MSDIYIYIYTCIHIYNIYTYLCVYKQLPGGLQRWSEVLQVFVLHVCLNIQYHYIKARVGVSGGSPLVPGGPGARCPPTCSCRSSEETDTSARLSVEDQRDSQRDNRGSEVGHVPQAGRDR